MTEFGLFIHDFIQQYRTFLDTVATTSSDQDCILHLTNATPSEIDTLTDYILVIFYGYYKLPSTHKHVMDNFKHERFTLELGNYIERRMLFMNFVHDVRTLTSLGLYKIPYNTHDDANDDADANDDDEYLNYSEEDSSQ